MLRIRTALAASLAISALSLASGFGTEVKGHEDPIEKQADQSGPRADALSSEDAVLLQSMRAKKAAFTPAPGIPSRFNIGSFSMMRAMPAAKLHFSEACAKGKSITLMAVGDVLLHTPLAIQGLSSPDGFRSLWAPVASYIKDADVTYANQEGPTAGNVGVSGRFVKDPGRKFDKVAYTSYPQFNYASSLPKDLRDSGFDVVSTANNHAMDRRSLGVDRTIEALRAAGLPFTGTISSDDLGHPERTAFTNEGGMKIAWIACTFSTNGIPDPKRQVFLCYGQRGALLEEIRKQKADPSVDAVIVTPHWGIEYNTTPEAAEKRLAHDMIEAGALIVFGGHPHVLQPVEKITSSDGREGFVIYSLGNFVSGQSFKLSTKTSAALFVGLTRKKNGEVVINGIRHLPLTMSFRGGISVKPAAGNFEPSHEFANLILSGSEELKPGEAVVTNPECR